MYGTKIRSFRQLRGFSQEYMAEQLSVRQNTYSKYENNGEKLPVETLEKIAKILGVTLADLISDTPIIINNQSSNQGSQVGHVENLYADQKELFIKVIQSKDEEIKNLKDVISSLKDVIAALSNGKK